MTKDEEQPERSRENFRVELMEELAEFERLLDDIKEAWRLIYEKSYPVEWCRK